MVLNMDRKKVFLLVVSLVLMSLFTNFVLAQQQQGGTFKLADIFETIKGFDVFEAYQKFPFLIDTLIYFLFFISIAMATLGEHFKGSGGKGVVIAAGLALSVGLSFWAQKVGFKLGNLGPLAALIFALVIGIWIYRIVRGDKEAGAGIWISIIVIWVAFNMFFPQLVSTLQADKWGSLLLGVLTLLFIIALPMAATQFFKGSGGGGGEEGGRWKGLWPGGGRGEPRTPEERREEREREREEAEERKERTEANKALGATKREREFVQQIINEDTGNLNTDTKIKRQLELIKEFINQYLKSKLPLGGIGLGEYRRRKSLIIPKIQEIIDLMNHNHERYRKVNEILQKNREVLDFIHQHVAGAAGHSATRLQALLQSHIGHPRHLPVYDLVKPGVAHRDIAAANALNYLNAHIVSRHNDKRTVIGHIEQKLNEALDELNKPEPRFPSSTFNTFTKKVFVDAEARVQEAITKLNYVIKVDENILKIGRRMEQYDQFLIDVLNAAVATDAHTPAPAY